MENQLSKLNFIGTINLPSLDIHFVPYIFLVQNGGGKDSIKISVIEPSFRKIVTTQREPVSNLQVDYYDVFEDIHMVSIVEILGVSFRLRFSNLYQLLLNQKNGEEGCLLTTGKGNVLFIDTPSFQSAVPVEASWDGGGWVLKAFLPGKRMTGMALYGDRVFIQHPPNRK
jgi:hypothetical protein